MAELKEGQLYVATKDFENWGVYKGMILVYHKFRFTPVSATAEKYMAAKAGSGTVPKSEGYLYLTKADVKEATSADVRTLLNEEGYKSGAFFHNGTKIESSSRMYILRNKKTGAVLKIKLAGQVVYSFRYTTQIKPVINRSRLLGEEPREEPKPKSKSKEMTKHQELLAKAKKEGGLTLNEDKGKIPYPLIELLLLRQEQQGNRKDLEVFKKSPTASDNQGGITWDKTPEGHVFWAKVLSREGGMPDKWEQEVEKALGSLPKETPKPEKTPEKETKQTKHEMKLMTIEEQILEVVKSHLHSDKAKQEMADSVEELLTSWGVDKSKRTLEVKLPKKPAISVGMVHFKYDLILQSVTARVNVALVGPAGSGKTTTAKKVAEALELPFYSKSVSAQTGIHEFFGYQDAQGRYVRTLFREAYENGGVFLLDEFDAGNPNVLAALNQGTANDSCAFADKMVAKHPDFVCIAAGNTFGNGANQQYVGRNKIDAATLDRFVFIVFPYDEDLEHALATNKAWCKKVQRFRKKADDKRLNVVISPRATLMGCALLETGMSEEDVTEITIFKGMTAEQRDLIS